MDLKEKTQNNNRHPWELSRTKNLIKTFKKYAPDKENVLIADIGAGDMYFDMQLIETLMNENVSSTIFAIDKCYDKQISDMAGIIILNDIQELEKDSVDCIIMMDILEHIERDSEFLGLVSERLKENGIVILTVPAFQSLFSEHDTFLLHHRRYEYSQLENLLCSKQFKILKGHYFYTTLAFARWLQIKLTETKERTKHTGIGKWNYGSNHVITKFIEVILNTDFYINEVLDGLGVHLPGLSILAIARKQK